MPVVGCLSCRVAGPGDALYWRQRCARRIGAAVAGESAAADCRQTPGGREEVTAPARPETQPPDTGDGEGSWDTRVVGRYDGKRLTAALQLRPEVSGQRPVPQPRVPTRERHRPLAKALRVRNRTLART